MYKNSSKVDVKIMNVTFQSGLANKARAPVPAETANKQKPRRSKRLVVDRIVGGKIMRAGATSNRRPSVLHEPSPCHSSDPDTKAPIKGALTQVLGKSSPRNLQTLRSMSKHKLSHQSLQKMVIQTTTPTLERQEMSFSVIAEQKVQHPPQVRSGKASPKV